MPNSSNGVGAGLKLEQTGGVKNYSNKTFCFFLSAWAPATLYVASVLRGVLGALHEC